MKVKLANENFHHAVHLHGMIYSVPCTIYYWIYSTQFLEPKSKLMNTFNELFRKFRNGVVDWQVTLTLHVKIVEFKKKNLSSFVSFHASSIFIFLSSYMSSFCEQKTMRKKYFYLIKRKKWENNKLLEVTMVFYYKSGIKYDWKRKLCCH